MLTGESVPEKLLFIGRQGSLRSSEELQHLSAVFLVNCITAKGRIRDYWVIHLKLALSIASFLAVNAVITFITGTYSGIYRSCSGKPAYMIAAGILFFSITFIVNAFLPISQRYRPKNGLTLAALALVLETAVR